MGLVAQPVKNLSAMQETTGLIPGSGRSPGEGNSSPLQCSCLENSMERSLVGKKSDTTERLNTFTFKCGILYTAKGVAFCCCC